MANKKVFHVGIAVYEHLELSDVAPVDMLNSIGYDFIKPLTSGGYAPIEALAEAPRIKIDWIHTNLNVVEATAGLFLKPTATYATAPRDLDLLLVPGLSIVGNHPEGSAEFLKEASEKSAIVMTTCGGGLWLASLGILDGKNATTNSGALTTARQLSPGVVWKDNNWVVDGKFWTSGAAGFGFGMMAAFCREKFPVGHVDRALAGLGFGRLGVGAFGTVE
ncbi:unnamed protein product [Clonostachys byssicola]|uniref:DJ-1/PfpI domain-containing protein n=1 Tax=Clonostachys byssicola TaxID=160290 RepID=A0A9N9Y828_9HYPO|nr:unnamed protein product [Clonostachys byssicola]